MFAEGLAEGISTQVGRAEWDMSTTMKEAMHANDAGVHANHSMHPFEGVESADGNIFGKVALGDLFSPQGTAIVLRETNKQPWGTSLQSQVFFKLNSPEASWSGHGHSARDAA